MAGRLQGVTIATPNIEESCAAYKRFLGYAGDRETMDADLAARLGQPALEGTVMAVLRPACGTNRFIRLVEGQMDHAPLTRFGWSAVELIVDNLDRLAERLDGSPFRIIGPPATLEFDFTDAIRAMQVVGPSGEVLYLTEVSGPVPGFDLPTAQTDVGPPFIAVAGVPDLDEWLDRAAKEGGLVSDIPYEAKITALSDALGLAPDMRHRLTTIRLGSSTYLEIDAFPAPAAPRADGDRLCGIIAVALASEDAVNVPASIGPLQFEQEN